MAKSGKRAKRRRTLSKTVVQTVIAGSLTAAAAGSAVATTVNESTDFPGSPPGTALPVGTDVVTGKIGDLSSFDPDDFFSFSGLQPGAGFSINADQTSGFAPASGSVSTSGGTQLDFGFLDEILTGTVPNDGILVVRLSVTGPSGEGDRGYTVTLDAPLAASVSGPSALSLTGLGAAIAGAFTWRRRKRAR